MTLPRKSGSPGAADLAFACSGADVTSGRVEPPAIVVVFHVGEQVAPRGIAIGIFGWWTGAVFGVPKKLTTGQLSRQFPLQLTDWTIAAARRMSR